MLRLLNLFTLLTLIYLANNGPAFAERWQYMTRTQSAMSNDKSIVSYNQHIQQWVIGFAIPQSAKIVDPTISFTKPDGSWKTYDVDVGIISTHYFPELKYSISRFPIDVGVLELLMASKDVIYTVSQVEYVVSLDGSRAAISKLITQVMYDQAVKDDEQHTIAQAKSDAIQARQRAITATANCDKLAGYEWDKNGVGTGVLWENLDSANAVAACQDAIDQTSLDPAALPRVAYQLGRAYDRMGDKRALEYIKISALKHGYAAALYHLALFFEDGLYTAKDQGQANAAFRAAHSAGNIPATYRTGRQLFENAKTNIDQLDAELMLQDAAKAGYLSAMMYYGSLIVDGQTTNITTVLGRIYLQDASKEGRADASYKLARMYRDGISVDVNDAKYLSYLKLAAQQGNKNAQRELSAQ